MPDVSESSRDSTETISACGGTAYTDQTAFEPFVGRISGVSPVQRTHILGRKALILGVGTKDSKCAKIYGQRFMVEMENDLMDEHVGEVSRSSVAMRLRRPCSQASPALTYPRPHLL